MSSPSVVDESVTATCAVLFRFLDALSCQQSAHAADSLAALDMPLSHLRMLFTLGRKDEAVSVNTLADAVGLSLAAAGRGADRLVGLELVDRREDPDDRRVKRLSLTDKGRTLLAEQFTQHSDDLADVIATLPEQLRNTLRSTLSDVLTHLSPEKVTS
ncbi:MarR family winged helix-turn-helix transcriptional regulator [Gordonia sp. HY002]|uniref:MarR family winged helix-turn-helix transcriptional regulator n=1 Tax=Gordonia zhenghanii TaxID=2911516 RepID=UPI001F1F9D86|nr:MarR family winged helix-turn-helix transcriptional regulator [Gordonia zhenghanii]MCF8568999.1 MarR family winged helix-turn-helix transcriptional regulator [Gordonia zhenghanii]